MPFQFSLHVKESPSSEVRHLGYLHKERSDPRPGVLAALKASMGDQGSIVVYSDFEQKVHRYLAKCFPDDADFLLGLNERVVDLARPFKSRALYHPDMGTSWSIKQVLPAFVPLLSYEGLEVSGGESASGRYEDWQNGRQFLCLKNCTWEVNSKNAEKNQKKLLPWDRHTVVDLPTGAIVDVEKFKRIQAHVRKFGGNRLRDKAARRVYPLTKTLQYEDGTPFGGRGARNHDGAKYLYYYNNAHNLHVSAELLEAEAWKVVQGIVSNDDSLKQALASRASQSSVAVETVRQGLRKLQGELEEMGADRGKLDARLDFLLGSKNRAALEGFRREYETRVDQLKERAQHQIEGHEQSR